MFSERPCRWNYDVKVILILMMLFCCTATASEHATLEHTNTSPSPPKPISIIYLIGDGMGPSYTSAYRYYQDDPNTAPIERTVFDELLVGMASTYPKDTTWVTDSAAAATALATGHKTYNGAIGVDNNKKPLPTLLEKAKELGYNTGLVVTSQINHATPASFVAHIDSRKRYDEIADQYLDSRIANRPKVDLMLGRGLSYFQRTDRDLLTEFNQLGYQTLIDYSQLKTLQSLPAIGLFAAKGLEHAIDSDDKTRLATMTRKALSLLSATPFFLLVEASQIDWCGHSNDIACAMAEVHDFAESLIVARQYVQQHPDTLLIATADHNTGGLSLGAEGKYVWRPSILKNITTSANPLALSLLKSDESWQKTWHQKTKIPLTKKWRAELQAAMDNREQNRGIRLEQQILKIINQHSYTGWTSHGHTAEDVPVYSTGRGSDLFRGYMDNTTIAKAIFTLLAP